MRSAGEYPYTVDLHRPVVDEDTPDAFGHKTTTYKLRAQCAARVWTTSTVNQSRDPGELTVHAPRLELLNPVSGVEVGWRIIWRGKIWQVDATEEREFNLIVTLSAVGT